VRDERSVDLNLLSNTRIVINATNSTLVAKIFNDPITFYIKGTNDYGDAPNVASQVTFIDKYNTTIFPLDNIQNSIEAFYNCGEQKWTYIVSDFVDGPNYNVSRSSESEVGFFSFMNQRL